MIRDTITKYHDRIMYEKYCGAKRKKCLNLLEGGRKGFKKEMALGGRAVKERTS